VIVTLEDVQKTWLETIAKRKGHTVNEALQVIVAFNFKAFEQNPHAPAINRIRWDFDVMLDEIDAKSDTLENAAHLIRELEVRLDIARKEQDARDLRQRLADLQSKTYIGEDEY